MVFGVIVGDLLGIGDLCQAALAVGVVSLPTHLTGPTLLVQLLLFENILSRPGHLILRMNLNKLLIQTQTRKRVQ